MPAKIFHNWTPPAGESEMRPKNFREPRRGYLAGHCGFKSALP
jgi:hypothetical protein